MMEARIGGWLDLLSMGRIEIEEVFRLYSWIESTLDDEDHIAMLPLLDEAVGFWRSMRRFAAARIEKEAPDVWDRFEDHVDHDRVGELRRAARVLGAERLEPVVFEAGAADLALGRLAAKFEARRSRSDVHQPGRAKLARAERELDCRRRMVAEARSILGVPPR